MTIYAVLIADAPVLARAFYTRESAELFMADVQEDHPSAKTAIRAMELDES